MTPAISSLRVRNLFSFGENAPSLELGSLNILIGPNGSGKSNFIGVLGLLKMMPNDFSGAVTNAGGISECLFKGNKGPAAALSGVVANVEVVATLARLRKSVRYKLSFTRRGKTLEIVDESLKSDEETPSETFLETKDGEPVLYVRGLAKRLPEEDVDAEQSTLSQLQDAKTYPEITYLGRLFRSFRLYPDWEFGQTSKVRDSYQAEAKNDFLEEDISNLGLMLNRFHSDPAIRPLLLKYLKDFYADAEDIHTPIQSGLVDIRLEEKRRVSIPATRLSDGTLRWLALLAILLHPTPPPLVCLEEPELGLHPDAIRTLAELLSDAAKRTQLIVTTHSDALVDQFTPTPEAVVVCEKREGSTVLERLDGKELGSWLQRYTLGQLWRTGEIGGNRW
jgi:predicted ATPase